MTRPTREKMCDIFLSYSLGPLHSVKMKPIVNESFMLNEVIFASRTLVRPWPERKDEKYSEQNKKMNASTLKRCIRVWHRSLVLGLYYLFFSVFFVLLFFVVGVDGLGFFSVLFNSDRHFFLAAWFLGWQLVSFATFIFHEQRGCSRLSPNELAGLTIR